MKDIGVRVMVRAENEDDAKELLECCEETDIQVLNYFNPVTKKSRLLAKPITIFEHFLEYCQESNPELATSIGNSLWGYFRFPYRHTAVMPDEQIWINQNLSKKSQKRILGEHLQETINRLGLHPKYD